MKDHTDTENRIAIPIFDTEQPGKEAVEMDCTEKEDYSWLALDDFDDNN